MKKIWQKDKTLNTPEIIEKYMAGNDYILDMEILPYDIWASKAHVKMLNNIGVITSEELHLLINWLNQVLQNYDCWKFIIEVSQEDGHTAIESYLISNYWEVGKKFIREDRVMIRFWLLFVFIRLII